MEAERAKPEAGGNDRNWRTQANCQGLEPNFMFAGDEGGIEAAKLVCSNCVVKEECLEYAIVNRMEYGVWGGTSEEDRRRMIRSRRTKSTG